MQTRNVLSTVDALLSVNLSVIILINCLVFELDCGVVQT